MVVGLPFFECPCLASTPPPKTQIVLALTLMRLVTLVLSAADTRSILFSKILSANATCCTANQTRKAQQDNTELTLPLQSALVKQHAGGLALCLTNVGHCYLLAAAQHTPMSPNIAATGPTKADVAHRVGTPCCQVQAAAGHMSRSNSANLHTCFIDHICWLSLIQVLHQVLAVNNCQHSIQLAGLLEIIVHKEGLQDSSTQQRTCYWWLMQERHDSTGKIATMRSAGCTTNNLLLCGWATWCLWYGWCACAHLNDRGWVS